MNTDAAAPHAHACYLPADSAASPPAPLQTQTAPAGGPYVPPAIIYRTHMEAIAADCLGWPGKAMGFCSIGNS
jgi:hypothetical protein